MATKKKAAEKKAAKPKGAAKKAPSAEPKSSGGFHVMEDPDQFSKGVASALRTVLTRRKGRETNLRPQNEMLIDTLPMRSLYFQWMINSRAIPKGVTNLVGKDRLGKTSLIWYLMGGFVQAGYPGLVAVCERKPVNAPWAARCITTERLVAEKMLQSVLTDTCQLLEEFAELAHEYCKVVRDPSSPQYVPLSVPIVLAADPINRLATNAQAAGISSYDGKDREKQVDIADHGHMWDRAKWLHDWVTRFLLDVDQYNVHLILSEHQNEDGPGGGGGKAPSFLPQYTKELNHRTKPGGQAINQVANLQLTFADKGYIYSAGEKVARRIILRPYKNSYGPEGRTCCFALKGDEFKDTDTYLDAGLRWDYTEVEWLAENGFLGFRKTGSTLAQERFSCPGLGLTQASLVEAAKGWREAPQELRDRLGEQLQIPGYVDVYAEIVKKLGTPDTEKDAG